MKKIFEIEDLTELELYLDSNIEIETIRKDLFLEFLKYSDYKNVTEWNRAVRLCECLAIVGWGNYEPLEAIRGVFFNGNPNTYFLNRKGEPRFVDAIWSKRTTGFTMEQGRTSYTASPDDPTQKPTINWDYEVKEDIEDLALQSQRNWIPKNPIWIDRTVGNCYENSKDFLKSVDEELNKDLQLNMQPEKYGRAINRIVLNCSFSYYDNGGCKTNYIISDKDKKLSSQQAWEELHTMYSDEEIRENGYFLRNRFVYGPFRSDTGRIVTKIHFDKQFSEMSTNSQKEQFSQYITIALNTIVSKLKKKKINYDFDLMLKDFNTILTKWVCNE